MRAIVAHLSAASATTARTSFARVNQLVSLLSLEREAEVLEIWTPPQKREADGARGAGVRWKLSAAEVRAVLGLRIEFSKEKIAQLKL